MPKFNEAQGAWEPDENEIDTTAEREILLRHIGNTPTQPETSPNPILFHPELVNREFGSHLLPVSKLTEWAKKQGLEVTTQPPIEGFQFVQVEAFLCSIERAAMGHTPAPMAAAIVQATPHLANNRAADIAPRWLVGADAHQQWRRLLERAVEAGELALLHFGSKLPIQARPEPQAAPVMKTKAKRRTWWDVSSPYIVDVMRAGQYATCKELYRALEAKAGPDSPFDKGTGVNRGSLFVREIARALDVKTVQNKWQTLRELAHK